MFLGLVCYIAVFLSNLAKHTQHLSTLTNVECDKNWPGWSNMHAATFNVIKTLILSHEYLTTIDHIAPSNNVIFVTCDTSNWHIGAVLSFGPIWEMVHSFAFELQQLTGAQLNYPIHKKELLTIVRTDTLAMPLSVKYTQETPL